MVSDENGLHLSPVSECSIATMITVNGGVITPPLGIPTPLTAILYAQSMWIWRDNDIPYACSICFGEYNFRSRTMRTWPLNGPIGDESETIEWPASFPYSSSFSCCSSLTCCSSL
jgi:hypothetical protein